MAYELKKSYKKWQNDSKNESDLKKVKEGLLAFYKLVEQSRNSAFLKAIKTFKNWQVEILLVISLVIPIFFRGH